MARSSECPEDLVRRFRATGDEEALWAFYNREAYVALYAKTKRKWATKASLLARMMDLEPSEVVIDVGCASQLLRPYVERSGAQYVGLDIAEGFSPDVIADAQARWPIDDDSADWIVLSDVLEHVARPMDVLREACRVGKRLLVVVPNWYRLERFASLLPRSTGDRHLHKMPPRRWMRMARECGWHVVQVRGFWYVPSIAFVPWRPLLIVDKLMRLSPLAVLSEPIDRFAGGWPLIRGLGQELILCARRAD